MVLKNKKVFQVICPDCQSVLWVDPLSHEVLKSEKMKRKKDSLDEMLLKEKKKKEGFARKFEATAELQEEKQKEARKKFDKAFDDLTKK